jgi:hypothetical protein
VKTILIKTTTHGRVLVREAAAPVAVVLGFHGYMENAQIQMARLEALAGSESWTLVAVQALNRFYKGRTEEVVASWMTRQDREAAIADNIEYVNRVVAAVSSGHEGLTHTARIEGLSHKARIEGLSHTSRIEGLSHTSPVGEPDRAVPIICIGFSQGVAMAFRAGVRGAHAGAGIVAVGGDVPPELFADPASVFPPVLLARGARDEWYTSAKLDADVAQLKSRGVEVETLTYDGAHEWTQEVSDAAREFISGRRTSA